MHSANLVRAGTMLSTNRDIRRAAIGGEAGLSSYPAARHPIEPLVMRGVKGRWTVSGRCALSLVLRDLATRGIHHIHVPSFVCQSVLFTIKANEVALSFYPVDMDLDVFPDPPAGSAVLLIDYFGWRNAGLGRSFCQSAQSVAVIEDASQAFLSRWKPIKNGNHYLLLSPRKFAPTVLGGWCNVPGEELSPVSVELESLAWRSLAARLAKGAYMSHPRCQAKADQEEFYLASFTALEEYLDKYCEPSAPPRFVLDLINRVSWLKVARKRRKNWLILNEGIAGSIEPLFKSLPEDVVPLGYVVKVPNRDRVRKRLAGRRIFCATHWPLPAEISRRRYPAAARLADHCLTLPVDQRYGASDMHRIADALKESL